MTSPKRCDIITIDSLTKAQLAFLTYCKELGWGKLEVIVKDGEPVMVIQSLKETKLD